MDQEEQLSEADPMQVEKIHEVRRHLGSGGSNGYTPSMRTLKGVINHRATRIVAFVIIAASLIACTVVCLLALWGYVAGDFAWKALASFGIICGATAVFVGMNEGFGPTVRNG